MTFKKFFTLACAVTIFFTLSDKCFSQNKPETKILYLKTKENPQVNLFVANCKNVLAHTDKKPNVLELDLNDPNLSIPAVFSETIKKVKSQKIDMILSLNFAPAINIAKHFPDTPVICSMIPKEDSEFLKLANNKTTGVATEVFLKEKFAFLKKIAPDVKQIGLLYRPQKYKQPVLNAKIAARENDIELILIPATNQAKMLESINTQIQKLDAITLLPGSDLSYPIELIKYITAICAENSKIFIGWEPKHISEGALFSIYPDIYSMSEKCGLIMKRIQEAESPTAINFEINKKFFLSYNLTIGKQLDIEIDEDTLNKIDIFSE